MAYLAVLLAAFLAAGLTLLSGFGLGTLVMPVFAIFYSVAVAATAAVHLATNLFRVADLAAALAGSLVGLRFVPNVTVRSLHLLVGVLLIVIGVALVTGLV